MTDEKVREVFARCRQAIEKYCAQSGVAPTAERGPVKTYWIFWTKSERYNHMLYVCDEGTRFVNEGRMDKAFRWIGWLQGVLVAEDVYTIEECGKLNMP